MVPAPPGQLFEGPQWIAEARSFQWVDILAASIHRWDPYESDAAESRETVLEFATVALPLDADRMLVAARNSLHIYSWGDRTLEALGQWDFPPDVRFNDGAIAPNGDVYVGTMSMERREGAASLYRFDLASGSMTEVLDDIGISNGLCWDTGATAFYVDSLKPQIDRITLVGDQVLREPWMQLGVEDEPDGLTLAPDGTLVVALWGGSRLALLPTSRGSVRSVSVPALFPTSVAFGGVESEFAVVTTATEGGEGVAQVLLAPTSEVLDAHDRS